MNEYELAGFTAEQAQQLSKYSNDTGVPAYAIISALRPLRTDESLEKLRRETNMQYAAWKLQRIAGLIVMLVLYPIKAVLFIPSQLDQLLTRFLYRLHR